VTDSKPVHVATQQKETENTASATEESAAAVDEYRAKLAEKRRLAREKAELEAAEQEERKRQQQSVDTLVMSLCVINIGIGNDICHCQC